MNRAILAVLFLPLFALPYADAQTVEEDISVDPDNEPWPKPYVVPEGDHHVGLHAYIQAKGTMIVINGFTPESYSSVNIGLEDPNGVGLLTSQVPVNSEGVFSEEILLTDIVDGAYHINITHPEMDSGNYIDVYVGASGGLLSNEDTISSTLNSVLPVKLTVNFDELNYRAIHIHGNTTVTDYPLILSTISPIDNIQFLDEIIVDINGEFSYTKYLPCLSIDKYYEITAYHYIDDFYHNRSTSVTIDACDNGPRIIRDVEAGSWYKPYTIPEGEHRYGMHSRVQANGNIVVVEGFTPESEHNSVVINIFVPDRKQIVYRINVDSDGMFKEGILLTRDDDIRDGHYRVSIRQLDIDPSRFMTMAIRGSAGNLTGDSSASTLTFEPPLRHELVAKFDMLNETAIHIHGNTTIIDQSLGLSVGFPSGDREYYEYVRANQNGEFSTIAHLTCSTYDKYYRIALYKHLAEFYYDERTYVTVNACEDNNPVAEPETWPKPYTIPDGDHRYGMDVRTQTEANGTLIRIDGFTHEPKLGTVTVGVLGPDKTFVAATPISINSDGIFRKNIRLDADVIENGTYRIDFVQGSQPVRLLQTAVYSTGENLTAEDNTVTTLSSDAPATHSMEADVGKMSNTDIYVEGETTMTDRAVHLFVTLDGSYIHRDLLRPAEDGEFSTSFSLECSDDNNRRYVVWLEQRVKEFTYRDYTTTVVNRCDDVNIPEPTVELLEYENDGALTFPIADTVRVEPTPSTSGNLDGPDGHDEDGPPVVSKVVGDVIDVAGGTTSFVAPLSSEPYMVTADGDIKMMVMKSVVDTVDISEHTIKNVAGNAVEDVPVEEPEDISTGKSTVEESTSETVPGATPESTPDPEPENVPEPESNLTAPTTEPPEVTAPVDLTPINISTPELPPAPPLPEGPVVQPNVTAPPDVPPVNMTTPELPPASEPNVTAPVDVVPVNMTEPELPTLPEAPVVQPNVTAPPDVPPVNMTTPELPPASEPDVTAPVDVVPVNMTEPELPPAPSLPEPTVPVNETRPETTPQPVPEVNQTIPEVEPQISDEEPAEPEKPEPPVPETIVPVGPEPIDPEPELPAEPVAPEEPATETTPPAPETDPVENTPAPPEETVEETTPAPPEETVEEPAGPTQVNLEPETVPEPPKAPAPPPAPPAQEPVQEPESEVQEPESIKEAMPEIEP
ncbi:ATPases involved in chromosome partitioning [Cenarchaeum symbiosum A]|uniref:ATPases involved in chromosome partitioning n=1 Tax=Cenarchaeum symbiosum (strain A) TaxID=414004 RepID=A0RY40_CENSY|nr:ATPases involved in chromosome partitioning [Cenarchaeum symbiosum A]